MTAPTFRFWTDADLDNLPPLSWLVDRILHDSGLTVLYGPSGVGKSFVALALAVGVALDRECLGRPVKGGRVVYLAAEGSRTLGTRVAALRDWHGVDSIPNLTVVPDAVYLHHAPHLAAYLAQLKERVEVPITLTIIDTLSRCSAGSDENSNADRELTVEGLNHIRAATEGAILAVHHTGWNEERMRGGSSLQAAADTILALKRTAGGIELKVEKQRDGEAGEVLPLHLQPHLNSLVAALGVVLGVASAQQVKILGTLNDSSLSDGLSTSVWKDASGLPATTFYAARKALVVGGYVEAVHGGKKWVVSEAGRSLLPTPKLLPTTSGSSANLLLPIPPPYGGEVGSMGAGESMVGDAWEAA